MRDHIRHGLAAGLVILFAAGCGSSQPAANEAAVLPAATATPRPTRPPAPTPAPTLGEKEKQKIVAAVVRAASCPGATVATVQDWFERMSVWQTEGLEVLLSGEVEEVSIGWDVTPTDDVVGGGWRVTYRWALDNGVTKPVPYRATFLYNPESGKSVPVDEWAQALVDNPCQ